MRKRSSKLQALLRLRLLALFCVATVTAGAQTATPSRVEALLGKKNLVAWCIVPFDAAKRGPAERSKMLVDLGLSRCAYDWRAEHVAEFEEEILQYKKHGIELTAFWDQHENAFRLFQKYRIAPAIWKTLGSPKKGTQNERVIAAAKSMLPLVKKTKEMGSALGLYNHGGWGGKPSNMIAVCRYLRKEHNAHHVGIVYNFHHGHGDIATFAEDFEAMLPYLHCVNLNGMTDPKSLNAETKILPIGAGKYEQDMIRIIVESGYKGPVGILDHVSNADAKVSLQNNLDGLEKIVAKLAK